MAQPAPRRLPTVLAAATIARTAPGTSVIVRGTVTRQRPGVSLYIQDETGGVFVDTDGTTLVTPGEIVEVTGIARMEQSAPAVTAADYRRIGSGSPPVPAEVTLASLRAGEHDAQLVRVTGTLLRVEHTRYEDALILRADDHEFRAWVLHEYEGRAGSTPPRSGLAVTGVASMLYAGDHATDFEILMRTGADAVVVTPARWLTAERIRTLLTTAGATVALLLSYILLLRRQVERQTSIIRRQLRAEAELKEQYLQAQRLEAIGRLAGGIAHDFNNIMTVVLGHSEIIDHETKADPELQTSIGQIKEAAERATLLTRQLLAFGRRQMLAPRPVDLNAVARDMGTLWSRVLGDEILVRVVEAEEPVTVVVDRLQLEQALLNLAVNARDAMPEGGTLTLSVSSAGAGDARSGRITVTDNGIGIDPEVRPHIFDPFFSTKDVGEGSGLGLAMVYGFVEQSHGAISVDSTPGQGASFALDFPLAAAV